MKTMKEFDLSLATKAFPLVVDGGVRWFGGVPLHTEAHLRAAADILDAQKGSSLVAIEAAAEPSLADVLTAGWPSLLDVPPVEVLRWVLDRGGVMFWPVGAFDDPESGVVALGPGPVIGRILQAT